MTNAIKIFAQVAMVQRRGAMISKKLCAGLLVLVTPQLVGAQTMFSTNDMVYKGAIRVPIGTYGDSRMGYAQGPFEVMDDESSSFMVGHTKDQAVAEFSLPPFSLAKEISELPMAQNKQPFVTVFDRIPDGNPQGINRITGLLFIEERLIVNGIEYYDAAADNTDTTFFIQDASQLGSSSVSGFRKLEARVHVSGWMTEVPQELYGLFEKEYIFGYANNTPINSRHSIGPSAFGVGLASIINSNPGDEIPTTSLIDYSLANPLAEDSNNETGENNLWTEESRAFLGFIVPGTETYAVFGTSGGHNSGVGYKITQDDGTVCPGFCPYKASDIYNYYWLYDINDMISVFQGKMLPHDVRPYEYGELLLPFQDQGGKPKLIIGADFNPATSTVFFMLGKADTLQSNYEAAPLLIAYRISLRGEGAGSESPPGAPSSVDVQ
ncbi:hypothetical protein LPB19_09855 [Marinobacter salinisoli]|uniref:Uncharacterized protein n=1 Tax=Marinobacter salinisoli TaxID=2769486 RepID=A0ABX7MPX8_9GAMM|nr:hypothetical protein [Marinobacter salinisoli]QSP93527.1 hypothetical protein LPB19_09855 [Marinobacter salinisoli]